MKRLVVLLGLMASFAFLLGCDLFGLLTTTTVATTSTAEVTTASTSTAVTGTTATTASDTTTAPPSSTTSTATQDTTTTVRTMTIITQTTQVTTTAATTSAPVTTTIATTTVTVTSGIVTTTTSGTIPVAGVLVDQVAHLYSAAEHPYDIVMAEAGLMRAYTLGDLDTYCVLYGPDMMMIVDDDDSGLSGNCQVELYLEPGSYLLIVMGYDDTEAGDYQLIVETVAPEDAAFLVNAVTVLAPGGVDRYDFTISEPGRLSAFTQGMTDTYGYLYGPGDELIDTSDDDGSYFNASFAYYLQPGDYYVLIEGYDSGETGEYRMVAVLEPDVAANLFFSEDATLLPGGSHEYTLTILEAGNLRAFTLGGLDTYGYLYDADHELLAEVDDEGYEYNFMIEYYVEPGIYYVVVEGYDAAVTGDYELDVDFLPCRPTSHFMTDYDHIDVGGEHWYDIVVTAESYIVAYTESDMDTYGMLYTDDMTLLAESDDGHVNTDFLILYRVVPGVYHLQVSGYDETDEGDYRLVVDVLTVPHQDSFYYYSHYGEITNGVGNEYQVTFDEPGYVIAFTVGSTDTFGSMYDAFDVLVTSDDDSYPDYNCIIFYAVDAGTYTFVIEGYDASTNGAYLFIVNFLPNY